MKIGYVLCVDAPDPDNPLMVLAARAFLLDTTVVGAATHLHVIVTGRSVDLSAVPSSSSCASSSSSRAVAMAATGNICGASEEPDLESECRLVTQSSVFRFALLLQSHIASQHRLHHLASDCASMRGMGTEQASGTGTGTVLLYGGPTAPSAAPISHCMHALDFVMHRKDLLGGCYGDQLTPQEYFAVVDNLRMMGSASQRRAFLTDALAAEPALFAQQQQQKQKNESERGEMGEAYEVRIREDLVGDLVQEEYDEIHVLCGGPLHALSMLSEHLTLRDRVRVVYAMFGAWTNATAKQQTLLRNNFNVECALEDAFRFTCPHLARQQFPNLKELVLVPTEPCKDARLCLSMRQEKLGCEALWNLQDTWTQLHGKVQPLFDVFPVVSYAVKHLAKFARFRDSWMRTVPVDVLRVRQSSVDTGAETLSMEVLDWASGPIYRIVQCAAASSTASAPPHFTFAVEYPLSNIDDIVSTYMFMLSLALS
eukprot:ANDGO_07186.mRNA.1 hypothetical protein